MCETAQTTGMWSCRFAPDRLLRQARAATGCLDWFETTLLTNMIADLNSTVEHTS